VKISRLDAVARAGGGEVFRHYQYEAPSLKVQPFERMAATSDGDKDGNTFIVALVLTARSLKDLERAEAVYLAMLKAY